MGIPRAFITIDDYDLKSTALRYRRWRFRREDRIVAWAINSSYKYVTSAEILRKRLAESGYDRAALEIEFAKCVQDIFASDDVQSYFESRCCEGKYTTAERVVACREASLDEWLLALKEHLVGKSDYFSPRKTEVPRNFPTRIDALVDILDTRITNSKAMCESDHSLPTFPCRSLDCMAVAMLDVVPSGAECVLDVTSLVDHELVYSFDDVMPAALLRRPVFFPATASEEEDI